MTRAHAAHAGPAFGVLRWVALVTALSACNAVRAHDEQVSPLIVPGEVNHEAVHTFERAHGRKPAREDLLAIHRVWINNEVLYREGKTLPAGEAGTREQVIARSLRAIEEKVSPPAVTIEELRHWFESRRERFEQPARFDFEDATPPGTNSEAAVLAAVRKLNAGAPGDARASSRFFKGRPESNLVQSYGSKAAAALTQAEPGKWLALETRDGWRAMRLLALQPAIRAEFNTQHEAIRRAWSDATLADRRSAAVQALWQKYQIEFDDTFKCAADQ
jgi:hypothetical protein